jgi:hypothetical protein
MKELRVNSTTFKKYIESYVENCKEKENSVIRKLKSYDIYTKDKTNLAHDVIEMILGGNESVPHNVVNAIFFLNFRNPEKGKILRQKIA